MSEQDYHETERRAQTAEEEYRRGQEYLDREASHPTVPPVNHDDYEVTRSYSDSSHTPEAMRDRHRQAETIHQVEVDSHGGFMSPLTPSGEARRQQHQTEMAQRQAQGKAMPEEHTGMAEQEDTEPSLSGTQKLDDDQLSEHDQDEPYGAQVLRRMYEEGTHLLDKYNTQAPMVEHPQVRRHMEKRLGMLAGMLKNTGGLFKKHYKHLAPLEGTEGTGEQGEKGMRTDQQVPPARVRFVPDVDPNRTGAAPSTPEEGPGVYVSEDRDIPPVGGSGVIRQRAQGRQTEVPYARAVPGAYRNLSGHPVSSPRAQLQRDAQADALKQEGHRPGYGGAEIYDAVNRRANRQGGVRTRPIKTEEPQPTTTQQEPRDHKSLPEVVASQADTIAQLTKDLQEIATKL